MRKQANKIRTATVELPISHDHGVPVLQDFLAEVQRQYNLEKNIKNNLYAFIIQEGLYSKFRSYHQLHDTNLPGGHEIALEAFGNNYSQEEEKEAILCMR